jgi:coiled-coil and C2 domain-containing protein 1
MLDDLLKKAYAGQAVNEEDIPPSVVTSAGKKSVEPQAPMPPSLSSSSSPPSEELAVPSRPAPPPPVPVLPPLPAVPPRRSRRVPFPGFEADNQNTSTFLAPAEQTNNNTTLDMLKERQTQYKRAAVQAKKADNTDLAIQYVRIAKVCLTLLQAVQL